MNSPYRPEKAEAEIGSQEVPKQQPMESRLNQAKPAKIDKVLPASDKTEHQTMTERLGDQSVSPQVAAEQRIEAAAPAHLREAPVPVQMTDTPVHAQDKSKPDCLLQSARMAEHRQTGVDPGLEAYKKPATEKGIYDHDGTNMVGMIDVINERPGIEAQLKPAQKPEDIKQALERKESVIIGVDTYEYYKGLYNLDPNGVGHALVVTSAEKSPSGDWMFTVNDPDSETPNQPVDGNRLLNAWNKKNSPMIVVKRRG